MNKTRRRKKFSGRKLAKLFVTLIVIAAIATVVVLRLQSKVEDEFAREEKDEVQEGRVTVGSISTSVYGSGRLYDDDVENIEIPAGVELEKLYVQSGDTIEEGAVLAKVDTNSVMAAMVTLNEDIAAVDSKINVASVQTVENLISSSVSGRVKEIYVQTGDDVMDVMLDKGALMLLSLDGYLAVDIPSGSLKEKDSVSVLASAGYRYSGKVDDVIGDTATVLVTDDGTVNGDAVTVTDFQGNELGSGSLYVHDPLKIIGYTGTVGYIWADINRYVYSGTSLLELQNQAYTVELDALVVERREMEDQLEELIALYRNGAIYAPFGGTVKEVNATDEETEETEEDTDTTTAETAQYISISPDNTMSVSVSVDESDILSVTVGQEAQVTINSLGDDVHTGSVTEIDRIGTSSSGVTVYTATVSIPKESGMLAGMSASTTIAIEGVDNALLIPVDALNRTRTSYYVYTSYDPETNTLGGMKEVTAGISNADYVEITSGLSRGDVIYYKESEDMFAYYMPSGMGSGGMSFGGPGGMSGRPGNMDGMPGGMGAARPSGR